MNKDLINPWFLLAHVGVFLALVVGGVAVLIDAWWPTFGLKKNWKIFAPTQPSDRSHGGLSHGRDQWAACGRWDGPLACSEGPGACCWSWLNRLYLLYWSWFVQQNLPLMARIYTVLQIFKHGTSHTCYQVYQSVGFSSASLVRCLGRFFPESNPQVGGSAMIAGTQVDATGTLDPKRKSWSRSNDMWCLSLIEIEWIYIYI